MSVSMLDAFLNGSIETKGLSCLVNNYRNPKKIHIISFNLLVRFSYVRDLLVRFAFYQAIFPLAKTSYISSSHFKVIFQIKTEHSVLWGNYLSKPYKTWYAWENSIWTLIFSANQISFLIWPIPEKIENNFLTKFPIPCLCFNWFYVVSRKIILRCFWINRKCLLKKFLDHIEKT